MVVARQRPETAHGVTFVLLEDEYGTVNLIVPPPVYERCREAVRSAPLVRARGRLERREGVVNVLVAELELLQMGEQSKADVRRMVRIENEGEHGDLDGLAIRRRAHELAIAELRAVVPAGHSFGRRGR